MDALVAKNRTDMEHSVRVKSKLQQDPANFHW